MRVHKINIKNFRLLETVDLLLEKRTTVVVGRNNSGKTSLTELFRRLLAETSPTFRLEDFSLSVHNQFWDAFIHSLENNAETETRNILPFIEVKVSIIYDNDAPSYGPLSEFIIDLDPNCTEALIVIRYELSDGEIIKFFNNIEFDSNAPLESQKVAFFCELKERLQKHYTCHVFAEDPSDPSNMKKLDWRKLRNLLQSGFINAQRGLSDATHSNDSNKRKNNILGSILEQLFSAAADSEDPQDQEVVNRLEEAIENIQQDISDSFNVQLENLLPAFEMFGYPGLSDPRLRTETTLDVERLLKNHTRVHYAGINGVNLPESYNGLGTRNLIYILLQLLEFYKSFTAQNSTLGIHLVFIEEPEVHLHPQMQEVFIDKLGAIAEIFARTFDNRSPWPVQFIVTTHSPHMANKAPFETMRYFLTHPKDTEGIFTTEIKDLKQGLENIPLPDMEFLHKYMTLTRCDLLFADKAILIEGAVERILLPEIIKKIETEHSDLNLSSQYISTLEVGGAYAHIFFDLIDFLELRTLIITDLDSVKLNDNQRYAACQVNEGTRTSNNCIKNWFDNNNITPEELLAMSEADKHQNQRRITYPIPEEGEAACGRSFEDTFILANHTAFQLQNPTEEEAWKEAKDIKKTSFAVEFAIEKVDWIVPRYIKEGLLWLANSSPRNEPQQVAANNNELEAI